jgi:hypothetical protein
LLSWLSKILTTTGLAGQRQDSSRRELRRSWLKYVKKSLCQGTLLHRDLKIGMMLSIWTATNGTVCCQFGYFSWLINFVIKLINFRSTDFILCISFSLMRTHNFISFVFTLNCWALLFELSAQPGNLHQCLCESMDTN